MIYISGLGTGQLHSFALSDLERAILLNKERSPVVYRYDSPNALVFELKMRSRVVASARHLLASGVRFATFANTRCNEQFWSRTANGGIRLRSGVLPSEGISDIFRNGTLYGFECAMAIVVIFYKAVLDSIGHRPFNAFFQDLLLWDWHYDKDLRLISFYNKNEAYPGDVLYFENPDYAPETPHWQGENAVVLADNLYYGHGIGIKTAEEMIAVLNMKRKPGATRPARLTEQVIHPDFDYMRKLSFRFEKPLIAAIGTRTYFYTGI